jgi:hypothetical protein
MSGKPRSALPSTSKLEWMAAGVTTAAALAVYLATFSRDLTWAHYGIDGGDLITAVMTQGAPHPTGYPTYIVLGKLVGSAPLGLVAARFSLLSALPMALAAGFTAAAAFRAFPAKNTDNVPAAIAAGLTLAFSTLVWGQAAIAEVYGLFMLFTAAFVWSLLTKRPFWLTGLLLGLAVTSHLTAWLLLPLALAQTPRRGWPQLGAGLLVGLLPFLLLPLLASDASPVVWGEPRTLGGWWWLVSGQLYRGYAFSLPSEQWLPRASAWLALFLRQFSWAAVPLLAASFILADRVQRKLIGLLWLTAVFFIMLAFGYSVNDAIVLTLPAWLLLSLTLVISLQRLGWWALSLPLALLLLNFPAHNLSGDRALRERAEALLADIPPAAIVQTPGDPTIFALWYFVYTENQRPDIIPVDADLFAHDWYRARLARLYPDLSGLTEDNLVEFAQENSQKRPFCTASLNPPESAATPYELHCTIR